MMTGDALVVAGADLAPDREPGAAHRRVPGPSRTAEVGRRRRVVLRGGRAGRRDHRLDGAQWGRQVEVGSVERGHRLVHQLLQPTLQRVFTNDCLAVRVEVDHRLVDRGAREDRLGQRRHLVLDSHELVPGPRVRLLGVGARSEKGPHTERVPLTPDAVGRAGSRGRVHLAEPAGELGQRRRRHRRRVVESTAQDVGPVLRIALEPRSGGVRAERFTPAQVASWSAQARAWRGAAKTPASCPASRASCTVR